MTAPPLMFGGQLAPLLPPDDPEARDAQFDQAQQQREASTTVGLELLSRPLSDYDRRCLLAMLGPLCPLAYTETPGFGDYAAWGNGLWDQLYPTVEPKLLIIERNRRFRLGQQWLSRIGNGPWKEPLASREAVRAVENVTAPALELRQQIVSEQRPGFRVKPTANTPNRRKRAQAQQQALEYTYDEQKMPLVISEAKYWAGTDGISYLETYYDPDAGPWEELPAEAAPGQMQMVSQPLGDMRTRVLRLEQVRVSPDKTRTGEARYIVVRERTTLGAMAARYGYAAAGAAEAYEFKPMQSPGGEGVWKQGMEQVTQETIFRSQATTYRTRVFVAPNEYLPRGLHLCVVGQQVVYLGPLETGRIPLVEFRDSTADPSPYPRAIMDSWTDCQTRLNMAKSKWIEAVRSPQTTLIRENAVPGDQIVMGQVSLLPVRGAQPLGDIALPLANGADRTRHMELYQSEKAQFEALSGWNAVTRGEFSAEASGRAILAVREQVERQFAPDVSAAAQAMSEWAKLQLGFMHEYYQVPRLIAALGEDRPDLARQMQSDDFAGVAEVEVDPETLMPMPRSLRLFVLNDMLQKQLITPAEYRRRLPYANMRNVETPDDEQYARAQRVAQAIRETGQPIPSPLYGVFWQDNESIHQDVLERELILPDDVPLQVKWAAQQRWFMLANQAGQKAGVVPMTGAPGQGGPGAPGGGGAALAPDQQPLLGSSPSVAAGPLVDSSHVGGTSDEQRLAPQFDQAVGR